MGEDKKTVNTELGGEGLWKETDGAEKSIERDLAWRSHILGILGGLARCPECGGEAKICIFGFDGEGVWVGCDETEECARNIEYHKEGWSVDDVAECWNHRNSGLNWLIRKVKGWFRKRFGRRAREDRGWEREIAAREEAEKEKRREVFGIEKPKREGKIPRLKNLFKKRRKQL